MPVSLYLLVVPACLFPALAIPRPTEVPVAVVDSGPSNLSSLRLQSCPWGCPDGLPDPNTARARPHRRPEGDGESSEGGRYRIWLLLGLVARHRRGNHSKYWRIKQMESQADCRAVGPHRGQKQHKRTIQGQGNRPCGFDCFHSSSAVVKVASRRVMIARQSQSRPCH